MHPADRLEQGEVRSELALLARDLEQPRPARVAVLVHVVAEAGDEPPGLPLRRTIVERHASYSRVGGRLSPPLERVGQERAAVLADAEEPGAATEQAGRQRPLHGVGRGQPGHRAAIAVGVKPWSASATSTASKTRVSPGPAALGDEAVGQLAEADPADQVGGEVLAEQRDARRGLVAPRAGLVGRRSVTGRRVEPGRSSGAVLVELGRRQRVAEPASPRTEIGCRVVGSARSPSPTLDHRLEARTARRWRSRRRWC